MSSDKQPMDELLKRMKVHIENVFGEIKQYNEDAKRNGKPEIPIDDELQRFLSKSIAAV